MWYSVELLESGKIFIQKSSDRDKHGPKGKVLIPNCLFKVAKQIESEN
jgi:hypothetical protein